jgi:hypothetical protein
MARTAAKSFASAAARKTSARGGKKGRHWNWGHKNSFVSDTKQWTKDARLRLPAPKNTVIGCVYAAVVHCGKGDDDKIIAQCQKMGIDKITKQGVRKQVQLKLRRFAKWGVIERTKNTRKALRKAKRFKLVGTPKSAPSTVAPKASAPKTRATGRPAVRRPAPPTQTPRNARPARRPARTAKAVATVAPVGPPAPPRPSRPVAARKRPTGNAGAKKQAAKRPAVEPAAPPTPAAQPAPPEPAAPNAAEIATEIPSQDPEPAPPDAWDKVS